MTTNQKTVRDAFKDFQLRDVLLRYCEGCWKNGWKPSKAKALANPENPFVGGPQSLLAKGITEITRPDGGKVAITKLTRLRLRDLDQGSLVAIGVAMGKDLVAIQEASAGDPKAKDLLGRDVVHQEWVDTYDENVANDRKHYLNNGVAAAAVLDAAVSYLGFGALRLDQFAAVLQLVLDGALPALATHLSLAARAAWIGRALQDGSSDTSSDFVFQQNLEQNAADIDPYVVQPVLAQFIEDLKSGYFVQQNS
ncbi:hypothetical protein HY632_05035 [Candidatus Uhrbacteria bacterium]|nr:hypothetical protein [Candidatus Uhrbacteria bacterium]